jgi:hypothetical protein
MPPGELTIAPAGAGEIVASLGLWPAEFKLLIGAKSALVGESDRRAFAKELEMRE